MPEGDTLYRSAAGLRPYLVGRRVTAARARLPGPQVDRLIGATISAVDALGKNLLIRFDSGLELRTHLRMQGSWHRYRPGERWRRPPSRAGLVLEVPGAVAVCFDTPVIELFETRTEKLHPALGSLGPDLLAEAFDFREAVGRLRAAARRDTSVAEALLDQQALAGIGNVFKSETLFVAGQDPFRSVGEIDDDTLVRLVSRARELMMASRDQVVRSTAGGPGARPGRLWVYGRAGRPCRTCGTVILARRHGRLPRTTYWCPTCQAGA